MTFILYAVVLIGLGILVRIFWVQIMMMGLLLSALASIAICSAAMSLFCQIVKACSTGNWFDEDFTTFFWYWAIPIGICFVLRFLITLDILNVASGWGTKIGNLFVYFKTKK